ncbi:hypothetical protein AK830_g5333 [Neonectria ditissima]|uniref:Uncharacterized protein n=1 Tax=Neonectria ditissima TaxID=78410 RepID=A0A0N8H7B2_9HYPO|nr:hypothetical protein AK830_g5333 [Neonectria ditissima]
MPNGYGEEGGDWRWGLGRVSWVLATATLVTWLMPHDIKAYSFISMGTWRYVVYCISVAIFIYLFAQFKNIDNILFCAPLATQIGKHIVDLVYNTLLKMKDCLLTSMRNADTDIEAYVHDQGLYHQPMPNEPRTYNAFSQSTQTPEQSNVSSLEASRPRNESSSGSFTQSSPCRETTFNPWLNPDEQSENTNISNDF